MPCLRCLRRRKIKAVGIIAEYDPFHNGHLYQMQKAKEETDADYCVVILGADFAQRGELSLFPRHIRAKMALEAGADLVVALPIHAAAAAAPDFARSSVGILDGLSCVDFISFGSECGNIEKLREAAVKSQNAQSAENPVLREKLKKGQTYAKALGDTIDGLCKPNDILGVEYIKALYCIQSRMLPHTIQREGDYHGRKDDGYSAGKIRNILGQLTDSKGEISKDFFSHKQEELRSLMPEFVYAIIKQAVGDKNYIFPDDLSPYLSYAMWKSVYSNADLTEIAGINSSMANRIVSCSSDFVSFSQFCARVKAKNFTYTGVARGLIRLTINIKESDMDVYKKCNYAPYARILGFRKSAADLLSHMRAHTSIPVISKAADYKRALDEKSQALFLQDIAASDLYHKIISAKYHLPAGISDIARQIAVV